MASMDDDAGAGDEPVEGRLSEALASPVTAAELCRVVGSRVRELRQAMNMTMSTFAAEADIPATQNNSHVHPFYIGCFAQ